MISIKVDCSKSRLYELFLIYNYICTFMIILPKIPIVEITGIFFRSSSPSPNFDFSLDFGFPLLKYTISNIMPMSAVVLITATATKSRLFNEKYFRYVSLFLSSSFCFVFTSSRMSQRQFISNN